MMLKHVNTKNRSIYAFELMDPPDAHTSVTDGGGDRVTEADSCQNGATCGEEVGLCMICLEECDGELKKHNGVNKCSLVMCDPCVEVNHILFPFVFSSIYSFVSIYSKSIAKDFSVKNKTTIHFHPMMTSAVSN